jgi:hypothetical protein
VLLDVNGEIGRVTMSVILVPFPKAEPASLPHPHRRKPARRSIRGGGRVGEEIASDKRLNAPLLLVPAKVAAMNCTQVNAT